MNATISWPLCHHKAGEELTTEIAGMTNYFFKISWEKLQWYQKREKKVHH